MRPLNELDGNNFFPNLIAANDPKTSLFPVSVTLFCSIPLAAGAITPLLTSSEQNVRRLFQQWDFDRSYNIELTSAVETAMGGDLNAVFILTFRRAFPSLQQAQDEKHALMHHYRNFCLLACGEHTLTPGGTIIVSWLMQDASGGNYADQLMTDGTRSTGPPTIGAG